jgi:hypothetical protein
LVRGDWAVPAGEGASLHVVWSIKTIEAYVVLAITIATVSCSTELSSTLIQHASLHRVVDGQSWTLSSSRGSKLV